MVWNWKQSNSNSTAQMWGCRSQHLGHGGQRIRSSSTAWVACNPVSNLSPTIPPHRPAMKATIKLNKKKTMTKFRSGITSVYQNRYTDGKLAWKKMLNSTCHLGISNYSNNEVELNDQQKGKELKRCWQGCRDTGTDCQSLLVVMQMEYSDIW